MDPIGSSGPCAVFAPSTRRDCALPPTTTQAGLADLLGRLQRAGQDLRSASDGDDIVIIEPLEKA